MKTQKNTMRKLQKTMSNLAILTWERWINPEICTPKKEITLAKLKEKTVAWDCLKFNTLFRGDSSYKVLQK